MDGGSGFCDVEMLRVCAHATLIANEREEEAIGVVAADGSYACDTRLGVGEEEKSRYFFTPSMRYGVVVL